MDHECIDIDPQIPTGICAICTDEAREEQENENTDN